MTSYKKLNTELLAAQAPKQWYPNAQRQGLSLRVGDISGSKGSSLWICLRTGRWLDHATGKGGSDLISLYAAMHCLSQSEAKNELESDRYPPVINVRPKASTKPKSTDPEKLAYISNLWARSIPVQGTHVEAYLRSRAISEKAFRDIRCIPELFHKPSENSFPAMLAAVRHGVTGKLMAVHRTWLKPDGSGKAHIKPNRMMLGKVLGGAVQLTEAASEILVAEGIETALSVMQATGTPTWATLSTTGLKGLVLPPIVKRVIIACDNDPAGIKAANEAAEIWTKASLRVSLAIPPKNHDFNDLLIRA